MQSSLNTTLRRGLIAAAALAAATLGSSWTAQACQASLANERVIALTVHVRTGGDNLRGNDDNAFIQIRGRRGALIGSTQVNPENIELRNNSRITRSIRPVRFARLRDLRTIRLFVRGFTGGFDGDNWNVDYLRVRATLQNRRVVTILERWNRPLVRFTGNRKQFRLRSDCFS